MENIETDAKTDPAGSKPMSESVRRFLELHGVVGGDGTFRRSDVSAFAKHESELRDLAEAGATLTLMCNYLEAQHGIKRSISTLSAWLHRHGVQLAGRPATHSET